jgi:hypothetical protein
MLFSSKKALLLNLLMCNTGQHCNNRDKLGSFTLIGDCWRLLNAFRYGGCRRRTLFFGANFLVYQYQLYFIGSFNQASFIHRTLWLEEILFFFPTDMKGKKNKNNMSDVKLVFKNWSEWTILAFCPSATCGLTWRFRVRIPPGCR